MADASARSELPVGVPGLPPPAFTCRADGTYLIIEYRFPQCLLSDALRAMDQAGGNSILTRRAGIRADLAAVFEMNERDHDRMPCGWHLHVRDVHVQCLREPPQATRSRKPGRWRRTSDAAVK